jgi:hypothetical protein
MHIYTKFINFPQKYSYKKRSYFLWLNGLTDGHKTGIVMKSFL